MAKGRINLSGKRLMLPLILMVALSIGISLYYLWGGRGKEEEGLRPVPKETRALQPGEIAGTEVGTGWSTKQNPAEAVSEALQMALEGKRHRVPDFLIVFPSSGSDLKGILLKIREMLGKEPMVFGGTSDSRAVMTNRGFVHVTKRAYEVALKEEGRGLALMTVKSKDITFGVGSANFMDYPSPKEASKAAALAAIKRAGESPGNRPNIVLLAPTLGTEEEVVEGIEEVVGRNTPILGGTVGGPKLAVFGENEAYEKGLSVAVIYTDLPIGWAFEGGFDTTSPHSGIVTKVNGQAILEIDHKPALDVYDKWLDGKIERLYNEKREPDAIRDLLTLNPICRRYTSPAGEDYFLFSHPWPKDNTLKERSVMTSTKIKPGERIYLSQGTWETLVNRVGKLPERAKASRGLDIQARPIFGIAVVCGGVMGAIPEKEREKLPMLINYASGGVPFIANFTWGEQGHFPGVGSKHGNLLTSFLFIAEPK